MRACFAFVVGCAVSAFGSAFGGEVSVLNHGQAPAAETVVVAAPAAVVEAAPCVKGQCNQQPQTICTNGKCSRVYGVETYESASHRHRLFGGTVSRNSTRTVVRPARR